MSCNNRSINLNNQLLPIKQKSFNSYRALGHHFSYYILDIWVVKG